ncbi:MAG: alpha/beta hydrolase [Steroidobacteraceae bacterium]
MSRRTTQGVGFAGAAMLLLAARCLAADLHPVIPLWPDGAPGSRGNSSPESVRLTEAGEHIVSNVQVPSVTAYLPPPGKATGASVIVIPGGGHRELWMDHEGYRVADYLANHGSAAFVLKYRLAREQGSTYTVEGESLSDVQRAIRVVRSRAADWRLDPARVGVMGFSAGGELAALAGTRYDDGAAGSPDPAARQSSRPGFQALLYPAIPPGLTFSPQTPRAFLLGGAQDQPAISLGLAELYLAMRRAGAEVELHIYERAGHGFGLRADNTGPVAAWPERFLEWLDPQGRELARGTKGSAILK